MEFKINEAKIDNINGNPCFILPEGTMIYFGSKNKIFENTKITFFGFKKAVAEKYGHIIHIFETTKDLHLLSFMDLEKTHPFYVKATDHMKRLLDTTFTIGTQGEKFRVTTGKSDVKIMEHLCETKEEHGCHGYAMNGNYRGDALGGNIHAEMALCPRINDVLVSRGYEEGVKSPPRAPNRKGKKRRANREANNDEQPMSFGSTPFFNMENNNNNTAYYTPPPGSPIKPPAAGPKGFIDNDNGYETPGGKKKRTKKNKKLKKEKRKTKRNKKSKKSKK
jgi:hypothetical protein